MAKSSIVVEEIFISKEGHLYYCKGEEAEFGGKLSDSVIQALCRENLQEYTLEEIDPERIVVLSGIGGDDVRVDTRLYTKKEQGGSRYICVSVA